MRGPVSNILIVASARSQPGRAGARLHSNESDLVMNVTVTLDGGCFLDSDPSFGEVGCFRSNDSDSDLRVYVDGEEATASHLIRLGSENAGVVMRRRTSGGQVSGDGVLESPNLRSSIARLKDLYGYDVAVDRASFDYILRIESGSLRPSVIKSRAFMETEKQPDGSMKPTGKWKELNPVAHCVVVHFELGDEDSWEIVGNGEVLFSTSELRGAGSVAIELATDDDAGERVYRDAFKQEPPTYWFPDGCNEGPSGPYPPCRP